MIQIYLFLKCYFSALLLYSSMVLLGHFNSFGSIVDCKVSRTKNGLCRVVTSAQINSTLGRLHCLHFQLSSNTAGRVIIIHQGAADTRFKKLCWRRMGFVIAKWILNWGKKYFKVKKQFKVFQLQFVFVSCMWSLHNQTVTIVIKVPWCSMKRRLNCV